MPSASNRRDPGRDHWGLRCAGGKDRSCGIERHFFGVGQLEPGAEHDYTVTFKVTTNVSAHVAHGASGGTFSADISSDWLKDTTITGWGGATLVVNSSDYGNANGEVTCEIIVDGRSEATNTGSGTNAMASCDASTLT